MGYQREREEFFSLFSREFPKASIYDARLLLRDASASQRYNEIVSSIDVGERELARLEKADAARDARVGARVRAIGGELETGGDPRGNPYAIKCPSGRILSVPGRGLPAHCFQ